MPNFSLGLSALRTSQHALDVVSNNIANAGTDGYHRRNVHLEALPPNQTDGFRIGAGVTVNFIERVRNQVTEASLTNVIADVSHVDQLLTLERQIEATLLNGDTSIGSELDDFFGEITKLTSAPDEPAQRAAVIETAQRFAGVLRQASSQLTELQEVVRFQIGQEVEGLNNNMTTLSELNIKIQSFSAQGVQPNAELDQRDALLNRIAEVIGITRNDHITGELNLMIGNASVQQGNQASEFSVKESDAGEIDLYLDDSDRPTGVQSGRLVALLEIFNTTIPKYQDKLNELAGNLIQSFDSVHATGVGLDGSFQHLLGSRLVESANAPLSQSGAAFPIQAGDLTVSVIDSDGNRSSDFITIDPDVDSLADVANRLSLIDGLNATVDPETNQLRIFANEGFKFDFTPNLETHPDTTGLTGTSIPTFRGEYAGDTNETLTFEVEGNGDVGISDNLYINVYSQSGTLMQRTNIGEGYEAGTDLDIGNGVSLNLSRGTLTTGDTFTTRLTSEPDETGILASLGLNTFFEGENARTIRVHADVRSNPGRFASGISNDAADTANLFRLAELEQSSSLPGQQTFSQYINEINIEIGFQINTDAALSTSLGSLKIRLEQERDSYSGVDLNEEIVYLQQHQKAYEAAVRVIQTADDILNELFNILR